MRTGNHQHANSNWVVASKDNPGSARTTEHAVLATLMDIREELRGITARLDCHETLSIPRLLREIKRNTTKRKRKRGMPR